MASTQIQCEMCCNEKAVGYCTTCGNVGETCIKLHKTVKVFQTHMVSMNDEKNGNSKVTKRDITEERCKQHPTERTIFLCKIHDSMLCSRCFHSEHLSCFKEVVDLLHEDINIDCDKVITMKSLFNELKAEILFLKDEAEHRQDSYKNNADTCVEKCMELGNRIKHRVDDLTRNFKDGIREIYKENVNTYSHITKTCDEKTKWCENEESKIDDFVDNKMAGRLYLASRHFEKEVSDARFHLKEIKRKHTFKGIEFKENKVILKCVFEDLEEVCEQHEENTGSDDVHANDVVAFITEINKTRRELIALLKKARNELDESEKARLSLRDELKQVKQDLDKSEKTRQSLCGELKQVKQDLDKSEKARLVLEAELKGTKEDLNQVERERAIFQAKFPHVKEHLNWTQPNGTVEVKTSIEYGERIIVLDFTFPDGIQMMHHPSPGNPITGCTFKGRLRLNYEGELLCRMLKAAFRRGLMFMLGKEGKVVLNGVSLYDDSVYTHGWSNCTLTLVRLCINSRVNICKNSKKRS
ncbi:uncharacterized protein LOC128239759 isoform X2 [Mya arenaria]|uniref:uncharacterized protein LOC128239759 isoform X2 n=1 Tax=Mya arenaria TaxID=6604 RepID=UPI0022DF566A|nr:uncharacterized protein LOC128239759 isoform X2 [Mya arenaria]